jgi:AbiEi antitoxin C-terminal domain
VLPRDPFPTADAAAAGYSPPRIGVLVATGTWVALRRGVYCTAERLQASRWSPRSEHVLMIQAALLAVRRPAVASGWSAALLSGLPPPARFHGRPPEHVTLTSSRGHSRQLSGMRVLVAPLPTDHVVADPEAPTTTPARTAVDLAVHAAGDERVDVLAVLDAVLYNGLATKAQLHEIAKLFEGWPGAARARALVDLADERAESPLESRSRAFFAATGLPIPEAQVELLDERGRFVGRSTSSGVSSARSVRPTVGSSTPASRSSTARSSARTGFESWDSRWCAGMQRTYATIRRPPPHESGRRSPAVPSFGLVSVIKARYLAG